MSHSLDWEGECWPEGGFRRGEPRPAKLTFLYNGDFSGNIEVVLPNWIASITLQHGAGPNQEGMASVHIPFEAIKELVFEYYRRSLVSALEDASGPELEDLISPAMHKELLQAYKPKGLIVPGLEDRGPESQR